MRIALILSMLALVVAWSPTARAQDGDPAVRAALAERLIDATARDLLQKTMTDVIERQSETLEGLTEEQRAWYEANALPILEPHLNRMIDSLEVQYATLFSEAELSALVAFYETPEGRVIAQKQAELGAEIGQQMQPMSQAYVVDLLEKFCARFDCEGPGGQAEGVKAN